VGGRYLDSNQTYPDGNSRRKGYVRKAERKNKRGGEGNPLSEYQIHPNHNYVSKKLIAEFRDHWDKVGNGRGTRGKKICCRDCFDRSEELTE